MLQKKEEKKDSHTLQELKLCANFCVLKFCNNIVCVHSCILITCICQKKLLF